MHVKPRLLKPTFSPPETLRQTARPHRYARKLREVLAAGLIAAIASAATLSGSAAAEPAKPAGTLAMLVMDHSRSMQGAVERIPRFRIMHDAVTASLKPHDGKLSLGLVSYGDSAQTSCTDFKLIQKPAPLDADKFAAKYRVLKPSGRTPVTAALEAAAKAMPKTGGDAHIVLIADGADSCSASPCAFARTLGRTRAKLHIHVIAFATTTRETAALTCLPLLTKGKFFTAATRAELETSLAQAFTLAAGGALEKPAPPKASSPIIPMVETPADPEAARIAALPLPKLALADVPRPRLGPRRARQIKIALRNAIPVPRDPPRGREPVARQILTGSINPAEKAAPKPAPGITAKPQPGQVADTTASGAPPGAPPSAPKAPGAAKPGQKLALRIKPAFFITPEDGKGKQGITLKAQLTGANEPIGRDIHWSVFRIQDLDAGKWRKAAETTAPTARFELEVGKYVVRAGFGHATAAILVPVEQGKIARATVVFNAGGLRVRQGVAFIDPPTSKAASLALTRIGPGEAIEKVSNVEPGKILRLNSGTYRVTSRIGKVNAQTTTDVVVKPGLLTDVQINHKAGMATARLVREPGGAALKKTAWELADETGKPLASGAGDTPGFILAPGTYRLNARHNGVITSGEFILKSGENKTVELVVNRK